MDSKPVKQPAPGPAILHIDAKCCNLFAAHLRGADKQLMGAAYDGYVPDFMPGRHGGDYVSLDIELATGRIIGWKPPTKKALKEKFGI